MDTSNTLLSYHNDFKIKEKYQAKFQAHRDADEVTQGSRKGCFVGCTLNSYDHNRFPDELGWPVWLGHLAEVIFEGLLKSECAQFGTDLLKAVPVGVDLEPIQHVIAIKRLENITDNCKDYEDIEGLKSAIQLIIECHHLTLKCKPCDWDAAESAARSAAESAESVEFDVIASELLRLIKSV